MKECFRCKIEKPVSEFFRDNSKKDGLQSRCKACERLRHRVKRENHKESETKRNKRYYIKNKEEILARRKKWYSENKEKSLSHEKVKIALKSGVLKRSECESCGDVKSIAHHDDYSMPLDVRWLCVKCHMRHHHGIETLSHSI